jgi:hypothetical protein
LPIDAIIGMDIIYPCLVKKILLTKDPLDLTKICLNSSFQSSERIEIAAAMSLQIAISARLAST